MRVHQRSPVLGVVDVDTAVWAYSVLPKAGFKSEALVAIIHDVRDREVPRESDSDEIWHRTIQSVFGNAINDDDARDRGFERIARSYFGTWRVTRVRWLVVHLPSFEQRVTMLEFFPRFWMPTLHTDFAKRRHIEGPVRAELATLLGCLPYHDELADVMGDA